MGPTVSASKRVELVDHRAHLISQALSKCAESMGLEHLSVLCREAEGVGNCSVGSASVQQIAACCCVVA